VVSFTPWSLYPQGKSLWYPLDRRLGGSQTRYDRGGEKKIFQLLPGLEPPIMQPVAQGYTAELSQLLDKEFISKINPITGLEKTNIKF
jgi:hypothetical protein